MTKEKPVVSYESPPDFDTLMEVINKIELLTLSEETLGIKLKRSMADIIKDARSNPEMFENGRPPSMSFIESTYAYSGFKNELIPLRTELAKVTSQLAHAKMLYAIYRDVIRIWQTLQASKRASVA